MGFRMECGRRRVSALLRTGPSRAAVQAYELHRGRMVLLSMVHRMGLSERPMGGLLVRVPPHGRRGCGLLSPGSDLVHGCSHPRRRHRSHPAGRHEHPEIFVEIFVWVGHPRRCYLSTICSISDSLPYLQPSTNNEVFRIFFRIFTSRRGYEMIVTHDDNPRNLCSNFIECAFQYELVPKPMRLDVYCSHP